ncbi:acyl-CoA synthetase [Hoeflea prorocentri]|uniref:Acyl-CoA synthetase n=1 Tax=Hoeflea prorocentri TaxID=1922333 RepID=A0A9X3UPP6_9HYPH|nr:acyl-CoA synthetase [Hoeflea prorocentri]MCY6382926.1 acyl-CoA synthetase [Hoeflea prorocentri]MDA5400726.1 acyl-CoA synthetase [Hoeflea prorocentri]
MPFEQSHPIRSIADIRRLEAIPLEEAVTAVSTYDIFAESARAFGDRPALTFLQTGNPDDEPIRWSYRELFEKITATANLFHGLGIGPDDAVAALLPACLEYHLVLWGGEAAGRVQPLNPLLDLDKLASLIETAGSKILVAYGAPEDADYWQKAMALRSRIDGLKVLRVAPHDEERPPEHQGDGDFQAGLRDQPSDRLVSGRTIAPQDIAAYFHTGGTTGAPKLAMHTHGNQVFTAWASVQLQGQTRDDVSINAYPLFHVAGVLPASLTALSAGVETIIPTTTLLRNPDVRANYWRIVEKYGATSLSAVPTVLAALANVPTDGADISSIRYCRTGAAPLAPELAARFETLFGLHVHESLGMTEMAGITSIRPPGVRGPAGCVGFPIPYSKMRVVAIDADGGPTDRDVGPGEAGMFLFKAPNVFPGFLNEEETRKAFTSDGWLVTGDVGWVDKDGRIHLTGRAKDLIIRSGHNIDPKVIEDALESHPAVQLSAAVGAPDAYAGELPVAFAVLMPGAGAVNEDELLDWTRGNVDEPPARPKSVTILPAMPTTNVGKIFKPELRRLAAERTVRELLAEAGADGAKANANLSAGGKLSVAVTLPAAMEAEKKEAIVARLTPLPIPYSIA